MHMHEFPAIKNYKNITFIGKYLSYFAAIGWMLTERERKILNKYGVWMEALIDGIIEPFINEQENL